MCSSGSSDSWKSIWAITRFARSSSMKVGRKMMRSFRSREKMSNARSPRGVCSTTIGTRAITLSLCFDPGVLDEDVEGLALAQPVPQRFEVAILLHHTTNGRHRALAGAGELFDLGLELVLGRGDRLLVGDGLQQEGPAHGLLGGRPELAHDFGVIPLDRLGIHSLLAQPVAGVLDRVGDLPHDHGAGHGDLVAGLLV